MPSAARKTGNLGAQGDVAVMVCSRKTPRWRGVAMLQLSLRSEIDAVGAG